MSTPDLGALNEADEAAFSASLAPLFEGAPRFLARLAVDRPFADWEALFEIARAIAHVMPEEEQIEFIDAHPRLGASPGAVSALSFREQGYHRPAPTADLAGELARLNDAYEARFGFRYCVFVAGRSPAALIPEFERALAGDRAAEIHRALDAVGDIAAARHLALAADARPSP